jgi:hypothetical protein
MSSRFYLPLTGPMTMRRFNRLAWGGADAARPHGLLAAGMESGELALWDPTKILANDE